MERHTFDDKLSVCIESNTISYNQSIFEPGQSRLKQLLSTTNKRYKFTNGPMFLVFSSTYQGCLIKCNGLVSD